jgi:hypothetical protein
MPRADMIASEPFRSKQRVDEVHEQPHGRETRNDVVHGYNRSQALTNSQNTVSDPMPTARYARSSSMVSLIDEQHVVTVSLEHASHATPPL